MLPAAEWFRILLGNQPKWEIQPWWRQRYKMDSLLQWACRVSAQSWKLIDFSKKQNTPAVGFVDPSQRMNYKDDKLAEKNRIALLNEIGFSWESSCTSNPNVERHQGELWTKHYNQLVKYKKQCKNCNVPGGTSASLSSVRGCISATALWKRKACGGLHCQVECNWIFRRLGLLKEKFIFSFWYGALEVS
jgi:hypothetical protein